MDRITFLDNAHQGKNNWWRYLLTSAFAWIGPFILILIVLIPFIILSQPVKMDINPTNVENAIDPLILMVMLGVYYTLSFVLFYLCSRFIQAKTIKKMITTVSKFNWKNVLKGAGLWSIIIGASLVVDVLINPSPVKLSLDLPFLTLLIASIIIFTIQASFEEIFFRGYLMQGIGLLTRKPFIPLFLTSVIFAIGHFWNGTSIITGITAVVNMFIFGMVLGIITLGENGLETAIGAHIANNILVTSIVGNVGIINDLPAMLTFGGGSSFGVPYFILPFILLTIVFWKKNDRIGLIFKTQEKLNDINQTSTPIQCVKCKTINPGIAVYCGECGGKVVREYASTPRKLVAFLIDMALLLVISGVLLVMFVLTFSIYNQDTFSPELISGIWIILTSIIIFVYLVLMEKNGNTIGKIAMGIKVVREDTQKPISYPQSIARNLFLVADLIPFIIPGLLGLIVSAKSDKKQRIGDMVAGTVVIKKQEL
ncbi:MAG: RDD family protein [Methanobacterium formicicum]